MALAVASGATAMKMITAAMPYGVTIVGKASGLKASAKLGGSVRSGGRALYCCSTCCRATRKRISPPVSTSTCSGMAKLASIRRPIPAAIATAATENRKARVASRRWKAGSVPCVMATKGPRILIGPSMRNSSAKIVCQSSGGTDVSGPAAARAGIGTRLSNSAAAPAWRRNAEGTRTSAGARPGVRPTSCKSSCIGRTLSDSCQTWIDVRQGRPTVTQ